VKRGKGKYPSFPKREGSGSGCSVPSGDEGEEVRGEKDSDPSAGLRPTTLGVKKIGWRRHAVPAQLLDNSIPLASWFPGLDP